MRLCAALVGLMTVSSLMAGEYPLAIESDMEVEYFVLEKAGSPAQMSLLLKRVRPGGTIYSRRLFDCEARTYQILGSWERLESMAQDSSCSESDMRPVEQGTIAYQLWQHACAKAEAPAQPRPHTAKAQQTPAR